MRSTLCEQTILCYNTVDCISFTPNTLVLIHLGQLGIKQTSPRAALAWRNDGFSDLWQCSVLADVSKHL